MHGGPFQGGPLHQGLEAVADALRMTEDELIDALQEGKTIAELANEQGMDLEDVVAAALAEAEIRLDEAVENGRLTEEQKAQILERLGDELPQRFAEPWEPRGPHGGLLGQFGEEFWSRYDAVAEALGLTPTELFSELHDGKSVAEVAEDQGVDPEEIQDALEEARAEMMEEGIRQAAENGRISDEQADWMLEGLENGFLPRGRAFGRESGSGFGHPFGGHGRRMGR